MPFKDEEMAIQDLEEVVLELPDQVIGVFQSLVLAQQVRSQEGTIKQLCTIHDRVTAVSLIVEESFLHGLITPGLFKFKLNFIPY